MALFPDSSALGRAELKPKKLTVSSSGSTNEVWVETLTATGGTRTLTFNGQTTAPIAYNASASTIQTALNALSNVDSGDIVVTGTGPFTYTFGGKYAGQDTPDLSVNPVGLNANYSVIAVVEAGDEETDAVQTETLSATGGSRVLTFDGESTPSLPYNASAATIQAALLELAALDEEDVVVSGSFPTFTYTFGGNYAASEVDPIIVNPTLLTGNASSLAKTKDGGLDAHVKEVVEEALKRQVTKEAMGSFAKVGNGPNDLEMALMPKPADIGDPDRYNEDGSPKYR